MTDEQSDAKPTLRDAAENLLIAIGMGWDIEGCVENLRAALAQSDAEPWRCPMILRRCERWLRHHVEATFQEEGGYDLWEAVKTTLAQSNAEPQPKSKCGAKRCDDLGCFGYCQAQSNAEPVAWQRLAEAISGKSRWITGNEEMAKEAAARGMKIRPLYTTPPRPDASAEPKVTLDEINAGMDRVLERRGFHIITNEARRYSLYNDIIESYQRGIRPVGHIDEFFGFSSMTASPRAADRSGK